MWRGYRGMGGEECSSASSPSPDPTRGSRDSPWPALEGLHAENCIIAASLDFPGEAFSHPPENFQVPSQPTSYI